MLVQIWNGARQTTAKFAAVTTGTAIKTLMQVKPSSTKPLKIVEWGFKCDAPSASALAVVELIEVDVAATVTAYGANDLHKLDAEALMAGDLTTNLIQVGTSASGFTGTAEGSITALRFFDGILQTIPSSNGYEYVKQFPLGREPFIQIDKFLRIRTHFGVAVNAICYVTLSD